jgi:hypothetical protein
MKIEEKSVENKTSGFCHGSREVGRKTGFRMPKIKFVLGVT